MKYKDKDKKKKIQTTKTNWKKLSERREKGSQKF